MHDLTPRGVSASFPVWVPNSERPLSFAVAANDNSAPNAVGVISASGAGFQRVTSFGAQYMAWYATPTRASCSRPSSACTAPWAPAGRRSSEHCRAAFNCGDMEPLTLLDGDRLVGFVTTFANDRAPEVDVAPVTPGTARRVLVEPQRRAAAPRGGRARLADRRPSSRHTGYRRCAGERARRPKADTVRRWLENIFNPPRTCPQCGAEGRRRHTVCRNCGYSFRTGQPAPPARPDSNSGDQLDRD